MAGARKEGGGVGRMRRLLAFTLLTFLVACTSRNLFMNGAKIVVSSFQGETTISPLQVIADEDYLMGATEVHPCGESYVIRYVKKPYHYGLYSPGKKTLQPLLLSGRGRNEMILSSTVAIKQAGGVNILSSFDISTSSLKEIDILESARSGSAHILDARQIAQNSNKVFELEDNKYLCQTLFGENGFSYIVSDSDNNVIEKYEIFGTGEHTEDYSFFSSADCLKLDGTRIAMCMRSLNKINVLGLNGNESYSIVTNRKEKKQNDLDEWRAGSEREQQNFYISSDCTDTHIYALYSPGDEIRVFDWSGKHEWRYKINNRLKYIRLSQDGHFLLGLSPEEIIYVYELNEW